MSYTLDKSLPVTRQSDERFILDGENAYWNFNYAFGGWVAAGAVKALQSRSDYRGSILTLNFTFMSAVEAGDILIKIELVSRRRTIDFWRIIIADPKTDKPICTADCIAGARRPSDIFYNDKIPDHAPIEKSVRVEPSDMVPRWMRDFDLRMAKGIPFRVNDHARSILFARESDGRPFDVLTAVAVVDSPMPRTFFLAENITTSSTLSLSTHIYASDEEIAEIGDDYLLLVTDCAGVNHSLFNQESRLFRQDGLLIAASYQTALSR